MNPTDIHQKLRPILDRQGATPAEAQDHLQQALVDYSDLFTALESMWLQKPAPEIWCPAEVCEHVLKVNQNNGKVVRLLSGDGPIPEAPKIPIEMEDGKPKAPSFLFPSNPPLSQESLLPVWQEANGKLTSVVSQVIRWGSTERLFYHPLFGDLDNLGWLQSITFHMRHHAKALRRDFLA